MTDMKDPTDVPKSAKDVLDSITNGLPDGWANQLEEPTDLPLDPIAGWEE